jgi:hypothetical protein
LCRFGSCAKVITEGGTKFAGEFDEFINKITLPYLIEEMFGARVESLSSKGWELHF